MKSQPEQLRGCSCMSMLLGTSIGFIVAILMIVDNTDDPGHIMGAIVFLVASIAISRSVGRWFDERLKSGAKQAGGGRRTAKRKKRNWETQPKGEPDITILYRNYRGEQKEFQGWHASMEPKGVHINVLVAPGRQRIALHRDRILNLDELGALKTTSSVRKKRTAEVRPSGPPDLVIHYRNFKDEEKEFKGWRATAKKKGAHLSIMVAPEGKRIALNRDKLLNLKDWDGLVFEDSSLDAGLSPKVERQESEPIQSFEPIQAQTEIQAIPESEHTSPPVSGETISPTEPAEPTHEAEATQQTVSNTVDVVITGAGISSYDANKTIQDLKPGISYFDAYNLLRDFPKVAFENLPPAEAEAIKARLEEADCTIELRPHGS